MDFNLENDVAIVTGAASCVGRAVSKILLENGAKVMMVDSASESLDEILKDIKKDGKTVESLACNIMIDDERSEVVKRTVKRLGNPTILINAATFGSLEDQSIIDGDEVGIDDFALPYFVNVLAAYRMICLCIPFMKNQVISNIIKHGKIVNISTNISNNISFNTCNACIKNLTKTLSLHICPYIRINCINCGLISSYILEENITKNQKNILINQTPLKRLGEAEDIAAAVLFFVSNASSWITGQILTVNGGGTQTLQESPDVINYLSLLSQGEATSISVTPREKKNKEVSFRSDKSLISTEPMHKSPRKLKHSKKSKKTRSCFTK
eukprot:GHVL01040198.1.p1 GENE.GHVL01040198.1~~GHVL01040198.1.p1  ORF type:complete len:326 (-),score=78.58 GHVL01040198.1:270-1247(-)